MNFYRARRKFAEMAGIETLQARGEYGLIAGSAKDRAIFATYAETGAWTPVRMRLLRDFFRKEGGTFIDIGANIGLTTIPIAQNLLVQCIAFEPEPRNVAYLRRNVERNCPHGNIRIEEVALLDRPGQITFELAEDNRGDHSIHVDGAGGGSGDGGRRTITVAAKALDEAVPTIPRLPLAVKLIAQGAEAAVIAGGPRTIAAAQMMVLLFCPNHLARARRDPAELIRFIAAQFDRGIAMPGETEPERWQPIGEIVALAEALVANPVRTPLDYFYFVLRKGND